MVVPVHYSINFCSAVEALSPESLIVTVIMNFYNQINIEARDVQGSTSSGRLNFFYIGT
jgi:hypothetical protein